MKPYYADDQVTLFHGDCLNVLAELPDASVDSVVTDPPYGLEFMGKDWDAPWKYGFGATGYADGKRMARPNFGSSRNPVCRTCRKHQRGKLRCECATPDYDERPADSNVAFQQWCQKWTPECLRVLKPGGHLLAFGGTRTWHRLAVAVEDAGFEMRDSIAWIYGSGFPKSRNLEGDWQGWGTALKPAFEPVVVARKPLAGTVAANVLAHGTGALNIDGCRVATTDSPRGSGNSLGYHGNGSGTGGNVTPDSGRWPSNVLLDPDTAAELDRQSGGIDEGGASRFFPVFRYNAKAPTDERPTANGIAHPTVKPLDLMRWLVRLVTPPNGVVLEPFAGSGTTAEACIHEHMRCIAIEREADYLPLIVARLTKPMEVGFDFGGAS